MEQITDLIQSVARLAKQPQLLNNSRVNKFALHVAGELRAHKFTRVSLATRQVWEAHLKNLITAHIKSMPSKGKTI